MHYAPLLEHIDIISTLPFISNQNITINIWYYTFDNWFCFMYKMLSKISLQLIFAFIRIRQIILLLFYYL